MLVQLEQPRVPPKSGEGLPQSASGQALGQVLPIRELQALLDAFNAFFPAVTAILDLEGKILQASGWQDICTHFHRTNPGSCGNCTESDTFLSENVKPGEYVAYRCRNGLWDVVTPLFLGDRHAGNLYTGQFFYDDEPVDEAAFIAQAEQFGFDVPTYLEALRRVPRVSRAHVEQVMDFLVRLTSILSQLGLVNLRLAQGVEARERLLGALKAEQAERQKLERSIQQAQKLESLGTMAGGLAHEYNNLLAALTGNLDFLQNEVPAGSEAARAVAQGQEAAARATTLTQQLLAYSGRGQFVVEPIEVGQLVAETLPLLRASLPCPVPVELDLAPALPFVRLDKSQARQVLLNLVTNAAEASGVEGAQAPVRIRTSARAVDVEELAANLLPTRLAPGPYVVIEVQDNGIGMAPAVLEKVFDPFFTTKFAGRGLGLPAVYGILSAHAGGLRIETAPGRGTTVLVYLPAATPLARSREPAPAPVTGQGSGAILVVDDEPMVTSMLRRLLTRGGWRVVVADGGEAALAAALEADGRFDLAILDVTMPGMSGPVLAAKLHGLYPRLTMVLSSGYDFEPIVSGPLAGGVAGFLAKPYASGALEALLLRLGLAPVAQNV